MRYACHYILDTSSIHLQMESAHEGEMPPVATGQKRAREPRMPPDSGDQSCNAGTPSARSQAPAAAEELPLVAESGATPAAEADASAVVADANPAMVEQLPFIQAPPLASSGPEGPALLNEKAWLQQQNSVLQQQLAQLQQQHAALCCVVATPAAAHAAAGVAATHKATTTGRRDATRVTARDRSSTVRACPHSKKLGRRAQANGM